MIRNGFIYLNMKNNGLQKICINSDGLHEAGIRSSDNDRTVQTHFMNLHQPLILKS